MWKNWHPGPDTRLKKEPAIGSLACPRPSSFSSSVRVALLRKLSPWFCPLSALDQDQNVLLIPTFPWPTSFSLGASSLSLKLLFSCYKIRMKKLIPRCRELTTQVRADLKHRNHPGRLRFEQNVHEPRAKCHAVRIQGKAGASVQHQTNQSKNKLSKNKLLLGQELQNTIPTNSSIDRGG